MIDEIFGAIARKGSEAGTAVKVLRNTSMALMILLSVDTHVMQRNMEQKLLSSKTTIRDRVIALVRSPSLKDMYWSFRERRELKALLRCWTV